MWWPLLKIPSCMRWWNSTNSNNPFSNNNSHGLHNHKCHLSNNLFSNLQSRLLLKHRHLLQPLLQPQLLSQLKHQSQLPPKLQSRQSKKNSHPLKTLQWLSLLLNSHQNLFKRKRAKNKLKKSNLRLKPNRLRRWTHSSNKWWWCNTTTLCLTWVNRWPRCHSCKCSSQCSWVSIHINNHTWCLKFSSNSHQLVLQWMIHSWFSISKTSTQASQKRFWCLKRSCTSPLLNSQCSLQWTSSCRPHLPSWCLLHSSQWCTLHSLRWHHLNLWTLLLSSWVRLPHFINLWRKSSH